MRGTYAQVGSGKGSGQVKDAEGLVSQNKGIFNQ